MIDMSYVTCISLNLQLSQSSSSIWTLADMQKRYKQIKQNCTDAYDLINDYGELSSGTEIVVLICLKVSSTN